MTLKKMGWQKQIVCGGGGGGQTSPTWGGGGGGTHPGFGYPLQNGPRELGLSMWSRIEKGGLSLTQKLSEGRLQEGPTLKGQ